MRSEDGSRRFRTEQLARLGELLAGFAHEVRNPLSTIGLNLQLVKEDFAAAEGARDKRTFKRLSVVEEEVRRLQGMLEEFLAFARMPELELAPTDINGLLRAVVEFSAPELAERGIALRFYPDGAAGRPGIDARQFRAAIVNLVRNAADACTEGDEVIVSSKREGDSVQVKVIDTGSGMTPEVLARVFEPYFSTKHAGTGLGLPTVRAVIDQHGGQVAVSSEPGKGTQFTITIPAGAPAAPRPTDAVAGDG